MANDLQLRDYQVDAVNTVNALPSGSRQAVVIATGLGKTVIGSRFAFKKRMLWISHRDELVHQPERYFVSQGYRFGVEQAGEHPDIHDQIISASVQTISRDNRLHAYRPDDFDIIVVDEMQHSAAPTYRKILDYFKPDKVIGLTATPKRGDGVRLTDIFDGICFSRDLQWGIKNNWLSDIRYLRVQANFDMAKVKKQMGDFSEHDLAETMEKSNNAEVVAKAYLDYCVQSNTQTLIYCPSVSICNLVYAAIMKILPDDLDETVEIITGETDKEKRRDILEQYREGKIHCIINCMVLTEGTDLPNTCAIIIDRPTANQSLFTQIVGRGTRLYPGKDNCMVIDVVGTNAKNRNVITAFNLFGIDPNAVPNKILKRAEGMKMSDFADMLEGAGTVTNLASYLKLQVEMVDIFNGTLLEMVKENKENGVKALSKVYESYLNDQRNTLNDKGLNFKDLVVRIMPSEKRKYQIQATFNGYVYLSEPDAVGRTMISFDFAKDVFRKDAEKLSLFNDVKSPYIPFDDAIDLVENFLTYVCPESMKYLWSQKERADRNNRPLTEKQDYRLKDDYNIKTNGASLLDANNAFAVFGTIKEYDKKKSDYESLYEASQKKRKTKKYTEWASDFAESQGEELSNEQTDQWNICVRVIADTKSMKIKNKIREQADFLSKFHDDGTRVLHARATYPSQYKPSDKQISYIRSLVNQLEDKNNHIILNLDSLSSISSNQASALISILKDLNREQIPSDMKLTTNLDQYITEDSARHKNGVYPFTSDVTFVETLIK